MEFDGVDELELDDEDLQPVQLKTTRLLWKAAAPAPLQNAKPAATGVQAPGLASAPVSLVPMGWPNCVQMASATDFTRQQPQRHAPPAWREPPGTAPALPRATDTSRPVLMPSQAQASRPAHQQHLTNPPSITKRPAELQHAVMPFKRTALPGLAHSSGPMQAPTGLGQRLAAPPQPPMQSSQRSTLMAPQPHMPCAAAGAFLPGPAGVLQRQLQQALPAGAAHGHGTPTSGRTQRLNRHGPEADLDFATPQWQAAQGMCTRLAGPQALCGVHPDEQRLGMLSKV